MCEPAHSIVQYEDDNDSWTDTFTKLQRFFGSKLRKIGRWFHISKMGAGHSLDLGYKVHEWLPDHIDYEGVWWQKDFKLDSFLQKPSGDAFDAAKGYHLTVCGANMRTLRRFLEDSLQKTENAYFYIRKFHEMLNADGRRKFSQRFYRKEVYTQLSTSQIKMFMGFTRKRNLFLPEWSDDENFWTLR